MIHVKWPNSRGCCLSKTEPVMIHVKWPNSWGCCLSKTEPIMIPVKWPNSWGCCLSKTEPVMIHVKWPNSERIILILLVVTIALGRSSWDCGLVKASASTDNCALQTHRNSFSWWCKKFTTDISMHVSSYWKMGGIFICLFCFFDGVVCIIVFLRFSVSGPSQKGSICEVQEWRWNKEGKSGSREILQSGPTGWCVLYHPATTCWLNASTAENLSVHMYAANVYVWEAVSQWKWVCVQICIGLCECMCLPVLEMAEADITGWLWRCLAWSKTFCLTSKQTKSPPPPRPPPKKPPNND